MVSSRIKNQLTPSRSFSNRLPSIYLDSMEEPDNPNHTTVFFVNASDQILEFVASPQPLLFLTSLAAHNIQDDILHYEDVLPGEAVKIAEFDEIYDNDLTLELTILWQAESGPAQHVIIQGKGPSKFRYHALEWRAENV